jgi:hypothetical protein
VLGIGTIWTSKGLLTGAGGADPRFTGAQATAAYQSIFNTAIVSVPVENTGEAGTRDSHWRESVFNNEIMTGFLNNGQSNPLSRVTAASLADLGYVVNLAAAENFTPLSPAGLTDSSLPLVSGTILAITDGFTILDPAESDASGTTQLKPQSLLEAPLRTLLTPLPTTGTIRDSLASLIFSPLPGTHLVTVNSGATTANVDFGNRALASVAGRFVFYNQSKFDGNDAAANASDDAAIASDKAALLPGATSSLTNYTSYNRGLNGIMVDIAGLPAATLSASDFDFKVGNSDTPGSWTTLATAPAVTVRPNAGAGGSSRVELVWASGAAIKQWLQVTVKANASTGLTTPDVFYLGNAVGESGNVAGDYSVSLSDELLARNNPVSIVPGTTVINRFDYNRDGTVSVIDQLLSRNNITTAVTKLKQITVPAALQASGLTAQAIIAAVIDNGVDRLAIDGVTANFDSTPTHSALRPQAMRSAGNGRPADSFTRADHAARAIKAEVDNDLLDLIVRR